MNLQGQFGLRTEGMPPVPPKRKRLSPKGNSADELLRILQTRKKNTTSGTNKGNK